MRELQWYPMFIAHTLEKKTVDRRDLGSSVPRGKSQTNSRKRDCETEVGSPES